jgi:hypothetical protein
MAIETRQSGFDNSLWGDCIILGGWFLVANGMGQQLGRVKSRGCRGSRWTLPGGEGTMRRLRTLPGARMERRCTGAALFEGLRTCTFRGLPVGAAGYAKIRRLAAVPFNARTCIRLATSAIPAGDPTAQVNSSS